jgi:hypothetical protein
VFAQLAQRMVVAVDMPVVHGMQEVTSRTSTGFARADVLDAARASSVARSVPRVVVVVCGLGANRAGDSPDFTQGPLSGCTVPPNWQTDCHLSSPGQLTLV